MLWPFKDAVFNAGYNTRYVVSSCTAGFLCPAHTPDGAPSCGLLNHLAAACQVHSIRLLLSPIL